MAYSRKHLEHPLDYQLLLSLLQDLDDLWEPTSLSREEVSKYSTDMRSLFTLTLKALITTAADNILIFLLNFQENNTRHFMWFTWNAMFFLFFFCLFFFFSVVCYKFT